MDKKLIIKNISIGMVMKPVSMFLSMMYIPIVLKFIGEERYGVWAIILNMLTWINIFDIGIGNGLRNRLTESCAAADYKAAQVYVSTAYIGTSILSAVFFITINSAWSIFSLNQFFNMEIAGENVNAVIVISIFFICVNFVLALNRTAAFAIQKSGVISIAGVFGQVIQVTAVFILSKAVTGNLMIIALVYGLVSLLDNIVLFVYLTKKNTYLVPKLRLADMRYMKSMLSLGAGFFAMQIGAMVLNTTDNLLISRLFGSTEVIPYNMVYKILNLFVTVHGIILMPMWSAFTEASARNDIGWIRRNLKRMNLMTLLLAGGVVLGAFLFEPFAAIWLGKKLVYEKTLIVIAAAYMIIQMFANNYSSLLCGVGHIKGAAVIASSGAVLNIPISIIFAKYFQMGLSGVILGSFCIMLLSFIGLPIISYRWMRDVENRNEYV